MASYQVKANSTAYPLVFLLTQSTDHITGLTGASPTVTLSKSGGAFASPAGTVTEIANGWYKVAGNATDTATLGPLALHATATGGDPVDVLYEVVAHDVQDAVHFGLTCLPNVASGSAGAIPTTGTGANQISVSSGLVTLAAVTHTGAVVPTVTTVTGAVAIDKTMVLSAARALDSIGDTSLTVNDALHCAIAAAAGREAVSGTSYVVKTPSTATVLRTFTLDSGSAPTSRT